MTNSHAVLRYRNRETLHVNDPIEIDADGQVVRLPGPDAEDVPFRMLKAVFYLGAAPQARPEGSRLAIEFEDGEVIRGVAPEYNPTHPGFYLYPEDEDRVSRVYIVSSAIVSIDVERL